MVYTSFRPLCPSAKGLRPLEPAKGRKAKAMEKTSQIHVRVTEDTRTKLLNICRASNKSQSAVIRKWANGRSVRAHVNTAALGELRQHFGLLKKCMEELRARNAMTPDLHKKLETTLDEITSMCRSVIRQEGRDET